MFNIFSRKVIAHVQNLLAKKVILRYSISVGSQQKSRSNRKRDEMKIIKIYDDDNTQIRQRRKADMLSTSE